VGITWPSLESLSLNTQASFQEHRADFFSVENILPFFDKEIVKILEISLLFSSVKSTKFSKFSCIKCGQIFNTKINNEKRRRHWEPQGD